MEQQRMWKKPSRSVLWQAIELYVANAYDGSPPSAVRARIETIHSLLERDLYNNPVFERDNHHPPLKLSLRLGNSVYPHMKLVIDCSPDGREFLFRADTHDSHCRPRSTSAEYAAFCRLAISNAEIAQRIESAWANAGLPTFKTYLRDDLARRAAAEQTRG